MIPTPSHVALLIERLVSTYSAAARKEEYQLPITPFCAKESPLFRTAQQFPFIPPDLALFRQLTILSLGYLLDLTYALNSIYDTDGF